MRAFFFFFFFFLSLVNGLHVYVSICPLVLLPPATLSPPFPSFNVKDDDDVDDEITCAPYVGHKRKE
jgi:hypothetical protein